MSVERILLYRLGSLGDFTVALPVLHLVERAFPDARRILLTNHPADARAPAARDVLGESGLVHEYVEYPTSLRDPAALGSLALRLRRLRADLLVYLTVPRGRLRPFRDATFFFACGIRRQIGVPLRGGLLDYRWRAAEARHEHESERLARCLSALGDADPSNPASWDLRLSAAEERAASAALTQHGVVGEFLACSIGTKFPTNDWGVERWHEALARLAALFPETRLVLLGSRVEASPSDAAASAWPADRRVNLCGRLAPRESAALLRRALLYVGHDSGPIHLAAAVGTPVVGVYSARHRPGPWFPYGPQHHVIYHQPPCHGCELSVCHRYAKRCITSISVEEVVGAVRAALEQRLEESAERVPRRGVGT